MCATARQDHALLEKAHRVLPGGSFGNTAADVIIRAGRGSRVWAKDGNEYVDYLKGDNKYYLSTSLTEADLGHTLGAWDEAISVMTAS